MDGYADPMGVVDSLDELSNVSSGVAEPIQEEIKLETDGDLKKQRLDSLFLSLWQKLKQIALQFSNLTLLDITGRLALQALDGTDAPAPRPIASPQTADVQRLAADLKARFMKEKGRMAHALPSFVTCHECRV